MNSQNQPALPSPSHASCKCVPQLQLSQVRQGPCQALPPSMRKPPQPKKPGSRAGLKIPAWMRLTPVDQVSLGRQQHCLTFFSSLVWGSSSPVQFPHSSVGAFQSESRSITEGSPIRASTQMSYVQINTTSQPHMSSTNAAKIPDVFLLAYVIFGCACMHVLNVLKHL